MKHLKILSLAALVLVAMVALSWWIYPQIWYYNTVVPSAVEPAPFEISEEVESVLY